MTEAELAALPAARHLRSVLTDLSMVSHVRGASYDSSPGKSDHSGGGPPPGGPDRQGDREDGYRQKSAQHFLRRYGRLARRLDRLSDASALAELAQILEDARQALQDWRKTPQTERPRPSDLTEYHKAQIAGDVRSARIVASEWGISHVTVLRYRERYSNPVRLRRESELRAADEPPDQ